MGNAMGSDRDAPGSNHVVGAVDGHQEVILQDVQGLVLVGVGCAVAWLCPPS